jgi:hypothetical protein
MAEIKKGIVKYIREWVGESKGLTNNFPPKKRSKELTGMDLDAFKAVL